MFQRPKPLDLMAFEELEAQADEGALDEFDSGDDMEMDAWDELDAAAGRDVRGRSRLRARGGTASRGALRGAAVGGVQNVGGRFPSSETKVILYIVNWSSFGRIKWRDPNPRVVAESALFSIWRYIRALRNEFVEESRVYTQSRDVSSVVGHAALLARMVEAGREATPVILSHTGDPDAGNPGFVWGPRQPDLTVVNWMDLFGVVASHVKGKWDKKEKFAWRLNNHALPRVEKHEFEGLKAREIFNRLSKVTSLDLPYGLNTLAVRPWNKADGTTGPARLPQGPLRGGCANAAASILWSVGLGHLIPSDDGKTPGAQFNMQISPKAFRNVRLPILIGENAFDSDGRAQDETLKTALRDLPTSFGSGVNIKFYDPSYWYDRMKDTPGAFEELRELFRGVYPKR